MHDAADPDQILDAAIGHHTAGRVDLAEAAYRTVLQHDPDQPDALNLLGLVLQGRGELNQSIALLRQALAADPDFPEALTNLARALRVTGAAEAAVEAARRAVALDPDLAEAHLQLGRALGDLHDKAGAVAALRQAATLAPESPDVLTQLGVALVDAEDSEAALAFLSTALTLHANRVEAMLALGAALASLNRLDEALNWLQGAVLRAPNDPATHAALAVVLHRRADIAGCIAACRRTLDFAPTRDDIWLLLGTNLAALGRFTEAEACCREALTLKPGSLEAQRDLARIGRQTHDAREVERLGAILDDPSLPRSDRITAGFVAGTLLDRAARYDAAFSAFEGANRLILASQTEAGRRYDRATLGHYVDWAVATFQQDRFHATLGLGDPSDLPVFIVGMPRSGTSLVEQIVASHKQVFGAGERKDIGHILHQLNEGVTPRPPDAWNRDAVRQTAAAQVARLRALGGPSARVIDKLPDNIQVLGQIAVLFPNARVIVCRRDLRDVCLSCYVQQFSDGMAWTSDQTDLADRALGIERLMDHWRSVLPLRMIDIGYEALVADLEGESRRLIAFLGLEWDPGCLAFHTTDRAVTTASVWQVRQPLYAGSVGRWRHYRDHLRPLLAGLVSSTGS